MSPDHPPIRPTLSRATEAGRLPIAESRRSASTMPTKKIAAQAAGDAGRRPEQVRHMADLLKLASSATRVQIILTLAEGECPVARLCEGLSQSQSGVSHQLAMLRRRAIVTARHRGKNVYYSLTDSGRSRLSSKPSSDQPSTCSRHPARRYSTDIHFRGAACEGYRPDCC
jgi:DNA-binding transcriptional ArsR family regulator